MKITGISKERLKIFFVLRITVLFLIFGFVFFLPEYVNANAPNGIYNNGLNGIYIDVNATPYTTFATYSFGQFAYTSQGCAWFASARVNQLTGVGSIIWSGLSWYNNCGTYGFTRGSTVRAKALACYEGHVSVVEIVDGNTVTISEGGYAVSSYASYGYTRIATMSVSELESRRGGTFLGYVYIGSSDSTPPTGYWAIPADGTTYRSTGTINLTVNANDNVSMGKVVFHALYDGVWHELGTDAHGGNGNYMLTWNYSLSPQDVLIHAHLYDSSGNLTNIYGPTIKLVSDFIPKKTIVYNDHIYSIYDTILNWGEAKTQCETMGGHLATITSAKEQEAVARLISSGANDYYYIAATDEAAEGTFKWVTNESFTYKNWSTGQPDNYGDSEDYLSMCKDGKWNDLPYAYNKAGFICEVEPITKPVATTIYNGTKYLLFDNNISWKNAKESCASLGGYLATITTAGEQQAITNLLAKGKKTYYYVGATDESSEGSFKWVTNESFAYSNWISGQPDNSGGSEHYLMLYKDGGWNDLTNSYNNTGFICELVTSPKVTATAGDGKATLKWNAVPGAKGYRVYFYNATTKTYKTLANVTGTAYTQSGLKNGTTYTYLVRSYSGSYFSEYTSANQVRVKPIATPKATAAAGDKKVTLKWNAVTGATEYRIYLYDTSTKKYSKAATVSKSALSYTFSKLTNGKLYTYLVLGYNGISESGHSLSNNVQAKPISAPVVTAKAGDKSITLKWAKVTAATSYSISSYNTLTKSYKTIANVTGTTYTQNGLKKGVSYTYLVRAYNGISWSAYTTANHVKATVPKLAAPIPTATAGDGKITLSWKAVSDAVSYRVSLYNATTKNYSTLTTTKNTTFTHSSLKNGTMYSYLVRAYDGKNWSAYTTSNHIQAMPIAAPKVTATAGDCKITLKWNSVKGATQYRISSYNASTKKYTVLSTVSGTSYTKTGLTNGIIYTYLVRAYNGKNWSAYTTANLVQVKPIATPKVTAEVGDCKVTLKWNAIKGAIRYQISSYNSGTEKYTTIASVTGTSYTKTGLTNGTTYIYLVRAYNGMNWSAYTTANLVKIKPIAAPKVTAKAGDGKVTLTWNKVTGAIKYNIYSYDSSIQKYTMLTSVTGTSYAKSGLVNGITYTYLVRAYNGISYSSYTAANHISFKPMYDSPIGNGKYHIINAANGLFMNGYSTDSDIFTYGLVTAPDDGSPEQIIIPIVQADGSYLLQIQRYEGMYISAVDGISAGNTLRASASSSTSFIIKADGNGKYIIAFKDNPNLVLTQGTDKPYSHYNHYFIRIQNNYGTTDQLWSFNPL